MPAGEPILGSSRSDGQLAGDDLENSNASSRHAAKVTPAPAARPPLVAPAQPYGLRLHDQRHL